MIKEFNRKTIYKSLFLGLLIAYLVSSLSMWWHLMPPLAIIMFFVVLIYNPIATTLVQFNKHKWGILIFSALFWVGLIGMSYTENKIDGWMDVILKSSFLLFALTYAIIPKGFIQKKDIKKVLNAFIFIVFGSSIYCFLTALIVYGSSSDPSVFYYTKLSFFQHPSYIGLSVNLALLIILNRWMIKKKEDKKVEFLFLLMVPWLIIFLFLLQSKAAIISLLLLVGMIFSFQLFLLKQTKKAFSFLITILMIISLSSLVVPNSLSRFQNAQKAVNIESQQDSEKESTAARMTLWKLAIETIFEGPIWGTGTGDVEEVFNERLLTKGFVDPGEAAYNSHSQYLQTTMKLGVLGFIALMLLLIYPLWMAYKRKNLLYLGLVIMMSFNLLVESMFERQAGLMFYAFFNAFIYFLMLKDETSPLTESR